MGDVEVTREFIACINAGDVDGLGRLMTSDHQLIVFDEAPLVGQRREHRGVARLRVVVAGVSDLPARDRCA